ncbi:class I SAM-dependent methyltransferase [Neolewinella antarctica]|uniref:Class I SAM-dependent methyltransferase n=1 Tax=Neolewinella antarctica TaxID=442734 RepID=A0ABX0X677_9BACT|nr:class I SAM-dependent methyltransferase [Neolewinella antarctica]NJC24590.1 hypothetical protein [Neolewinella antarctica]
MVDKIKTLGKVISHQRDIRALVSNYFTFQEHADKTAYGSISLDDEKGLERGIQLAADHPGPIIEIGALFGHTTNLIASKKAIDKELIAVENYIWNPFQLPEGAHKMFLHRTLRYVMDHANVRIAETDAASFYRDNPTLRPSMVFIDAEHHFAAVKRDIDWALSAGCRVISGHDYLDLHPGVVRAVEESFGTDFEVFGSVWVHRAP